MRLGQLSRKTGIKSDEIVDFLASQDIEVKRGGNAKVDDAHLPLIYDHFNIAITDEPEADSDNEQIEEVPESVNANLDPSQEIAEFHAGIDIEEEYSEEELAEIKRKLEEQKAEYEKAPSEDRELIKAPKLNLPGLKVVGKIDLPEPKVKDDSETETEEEKKTTESTNDGEVQEITERDLRKERRQRGKRKPRNRNTRKQPNINPVELERRKAQKEAERQKKLRKKAEKERKRKFYEENIQKAVREKVTSKPEKDTSQPIKPTISQTKESTRSQPTKSKKSGNILVRIWRWLDAKDPTASN